MEEYKSKVYVLLDPENRVLRIDGGYTMQNVDTDTWTLIDEGEGDRFNLCQSHYLDKSLTDERGIYRYEYVDGTITERTQTEMDADYVEPVPVVDPIEELSERTAETESALETLMLAATEAFENTEALREETTVTIETLMMAVCEIYEAVNA